MTRYKRTPIIEAAADVHFDPPLTSREQERLRDRLKKRYPAIQETYSVELRVELGKANAKPSSTGFRMDNGEGDLVVMIGKSSFTTVRRAPYRTWEDLMEQASTNFSLFQKIAGTRVITRIGTRFINRFDILSQEFAISSGDLLRLFVPSPNLEELNLTTYFMQIDGIDMKSGYTVKIASGITPPVLIDHTSCVLDIDVISLNLPITYQSVWQHFNCMRPVKNRIFESSMTDRMRNALNE